MAPSHAIAGCGVGDGHAKKGEAEDDENEVEHGVVRVAGMAKARLWLEAA